jgi:hypothetical protein
MEPCVKVSLRAALPVQSQMYKNITDIPIPNEEKAGVFAGIYSEAISGLLSCTTLSPIELI